MTNFLRQDAADLAALMARAQYNGIAEAMRAVVLYNKLQTIANTPDAPALTGEVGGGDTAGNA